MAALRRWNAHSATWWAHILRIPEVTRSGDFFMLGGDSVNGARLLTSVKAVCGVDHPIEYLFRNATSPAGMACAIEGAPALNGVHHG